MEETQYKKHWSFIVCDIKYLFPFVALLLVLGIAAAVFLNDPEQLNRVGNFIIGIGVWMSMRATLRDGINRYKNYADNLPVQPNTRQLNSAYFNNITFSIGDAYLQIYGFIIVILGSFIGSYGDLAFIFISIMFK